MKEKGILSNLLYAGSIPWYQDNDILRKLETNSLKNTDIKFSKKFKKSNLAIYKKRVL